MLILINGNINAGKSTVAKILTEKIPNTANVEIDSLRHFIAWMPIEESVPLNLENAASVINNFAKRKMNVVVNYPLSKKNYEYLVSRLDIPKAEIQVFSLNPDIQIILNERDGKKAEYYGDRIKHLDAKQIANPDFGITIDSSKLTPEETAEIILESIKGKK